jgi:hypothetical protein
MVDIKMGKKPPEDGAVPAFGDITGLDEKMKARPAEYYANKYGGSALCADQPLPEVPAEEEPSENSDA